MKTVIHWFRRDLRISDNTALSAAAREQARVIPVYVLSDWRGAHRWTGPTRQQFLCGCLSALAGNLEAIGGRLIIRRGDAVGELEKLAAETGAEAVYYNRDPDPHGRLVEEDLAKACERRGLRVHSFKDVCIHEGSEILNGSGQPFRVFTPYSKAWTKVPRPAMSPRPRDLGTPTGIASLPLPALPDWGLDHASPGLLEAGEKSARRRFKIFLSGGLTGYAAGRDLPGGQRTSRISQDLRFGLLSIREVFDEVESATAGLPAAGRGSAEKFFSELVWREFYMQILRHFPNVLEEEFNPVFRGMRWPGNPEHFQRWKDGATGFPIVDAAMRELHQTGFMHNRARMIAAMFLTKDLHLDWRLGEQFFMQKLTDGEISSNNGGWQWSAGTGADAAPYFRIQNPWTQTRHYDPDGVYIKTWIPELRDVAPENFFDPPSGGSSLARNYPLPVVDHAQARELTLDLFASQKAKSPSGAGRKGFC